jgi:hypothetical protein
VEEDLENSAAIVARYYTCPHCDEPVETETELVALEISVFRTADDHPVAKDMNGDYSFPPYLLHRECWEWVEDSARETVADTPVKLVTSVACHTCRGSLSEDDPCVCATAGELVDSRVDGLTFQRQELPQVSCLLCLASSIEELFNEWQDLEEYY